MYLLSGKFPEVGLLGQNITAYVLLLNIAKFSKRIVPVCFPTMSVPLPIALPTEGHAL